MAEQVERVIDAAVASAVVDLEAPPGERVRFGTGAVEAVAALARDMSARAQVLAVLRERLSVAILAMEQMGIDTDWHDAQATQALLSLVEGTTRGVERA